MLQGYIYFRAKGFKIRPYLWTGKIPQDQQLLHLCYTHLETHILSPNAAKAECAVDPRQPLQQAHGSEWYNFDDRTPWKAPSRTTDVLSGARQADFDVFLHLAPPA
jgi:hypothetical protein